MRFGMNLLLYTVTVTEETLALSEKLLAYGFDALEYPVLDVTPEAAAKVGAWHKDRGVGVTTVTVLGEGEDPLSGDAAALQKAKDSLTKSIERTAAMGGTHLVGPMTQPLGHFTGKPASADEISRCVEFLQEMAPVAESHDVKLAVEPLNRFEIYYPNTAAQSKDLVDRVDHPAVGVLYDTFHANIEERNLKDAAKTLGDRLFHVHISANDRGIPNEHCTIPWKQAYKGLAAVGYSGTLVIEAFGSAMPEIAAATSIWRPLFDQPEDVCREGLAFMKKMARTHGL